MRMRRARRGSSPCRAWITASRHIRRRRLLTIAWAPATTRSPPPRRSSRSFARQWRLAELLCRRSRLVRRSDDEPADEQLALVIGTELEVHHFFALRLAA